MTTTTESAAPFAEWCIVELLGHRRLAGYVQEVQLAGAGFLRLDIPAADDDPGRTQYIAPGSVYALHPVTEETARRAAATWRPEPVQRWELAALPAEPETFRQAADHLLDEDDEDLYDEDPLEALTP